VSVAVAGANPSSLAIPEPALKVLHYPTDTGGNPSGLGRAERQLGAASTVAVIRRSLYAYDVELDLRLGDRSKLGRLAGRLRFAAQALGEYDVFHFNFGQTLLPRRGRLGLDLPLLRALGKRVFMTFQGSDARAGAADIDFVRRHCHRTFCVNPDLLRFVPGSEFVPYASVDPRIITPETREPRRGPIRIVHAPTNREIKGTEHVLAAVERLRGRHDVELRLVEGLPHAEAMQLYRDADLVIDQLRIGWYGGFAVEAMAMGKPVVCHIADEDLELVPEAMRRALPIVRATPESLPDVLDDLLRHEGWRSRDGCSRSTPIRTGGSGTPTESLER
jgi:glycosyltransferase involved in cell wall biosynthesis